ncbi:MAG: hypothetical protein M1281_14925 [Chloroflexi bacterium]|nr:hypothetical protein [Chloroflexota bacterium]
MDQAAAEKLLAGHPPLKPPPPQYCPENTVRDRGNHFIPLTCPSCGGKLQITDDCDRFFCEYCGIEHLAKRSGGAISLIPVVRELKGIRTNTAQMASEMAIPRVEAEIRQLENAIDRVSSDPKYAFHKTYDDDPPLKKKSSGYFSVSFLLILAGIGLYYFDNGSQVSWPPLISSDVEIFAVLILVMALLGFLFGALNNSRIDDDNKEILQANLDVKNADQQRYRAGLLEQENILANLNQDLDGKQKLLAHHQDVVDHY